MESTKASDCGPWWYVCGKEDSSRLFQFYIEPNGCKGNYTWYASLTVKLYWQVSAFFLFYFILIHICSSSLSTLPSLYILFLPYLLFIFSFFPTFSLYSLSSLPSLYILFLPYLLFIFSFFPTVSLYSLSSLPSLYILFLPYLLFVLLLPYLLFVLFLPFLLFVLFLPYLLLNIFLPLTLYIFLLLYVFFLYPSSLYFLFLFLLSYFLLHRYRQLMTLKRRNGLDFVFTSLSHLYLFVALCIYILKLQRAFFLFKFKRSNWKNTQERAHCSALYFSHFLGTFFSRSIVLYFFLN